MPKSLSGLTTGDFDDVEVANSMTVHQKLETKGTFKMSGEQPAEFTHLQVGDATTNGDLYVYGNIVHRNGSISSLGGSALPDLAFTFADGSKLSVGSLCPTPWTILATGT